MSFGASDAEEVLCAACGYDLRAGPAGVCPECGRSEEERRAIANRRIGRTVVMIGGILAAPLLLCVCPVLWYFIPNLGLPVGYYGRLNRTREVVRAIPGVTVQNEGVNYDTFVEEISYRCIVHRRWNVELFIPQEVELSRATHIVFDHVEATATLTPIEAPASGVYFAYTAPEGIAFKLGPKGDLAGRTASEIHTAADVMEHLDEILEYLRSTPLETLHERHAATRRVPGAVYLRVRDALPPGGK